MLKERREWKIENESRFLEREGRRTNHSEGYQGNEIKKKKEVGVRDNKERGK